MIMRGRYLFLNNWYPFPIKCELGLFYNVEGAYQAYRSPEHAEQFMRLSGQAANKLGKTFADPENWDKEKVKVMRKLLKIKFKDNDLRDLLQTISEPIINEVNDKDDTFWGVYKGMGENMLGKLLTEIRDNSLNKSEIEARICQIPVPRSECEDARRKCEDCPYKDNCDYFWISKLWENENKTFGKDTLLGYLNPAFVKPDFRGGKVLTITGKYDFCCYNVPKSKDVVVIGDIYVDEAARGQGISKKILQYLMETYDRDIFAKCVRGTSAETFWSHVGIQVNANIDDPTAADFYEHRAGKRDLGWYRVSNQQKKADKEELW